MTYIHPRPKTTSFTGTGLEGWSFGPLVQKDVDVYYIESEKGHDTFMVSKKVTRIYFVLSGQGYFTINNCRYDVCPGMLVEVPPRLEYSYSGKMTLLAFSRPHATSHSDTHTRWNPDVTCRNPSSLPGREPWVTRLIRLKIAGKSPAGAFLRVNRWLWDHLPRGFTSRHSIQLYGNCVHTLARIKGERAQASSTHFLRNRPELDLIRRLLKLKNRDETLSIAVLGCSLGAEAYSVAWSVKSARPDLNLILSAADISRHVVEFAQRGVYSLLDSELTTKQIFERMTAVEMEEFFETSKEAAVIRPRIKEGIRWHIGDVGEPEFTDSLGPQDMVIANNFLCHMVPSEAERCLRNIARLVVPDGYLFVSGIDLDVRTKVACDLGWRPLQDLLEEIHEGDPVLRTRWPFHYAGLEPLNKKRRDWRTRYAAAFQVPRAKVPTIQSENERTVATST